jgi:hypothetical protein
MQKLQLNHDSITPFTSWLQQNHINDTTAMKLRLCCVLNFCNSWAKGSPSPSWKTTNKSETYCIIAGRLINLLSSSEVFLHEMRRTANNGRHFDKMDSSLDPRHHIWSSEIICQIACKFRQRRQRLIKSKTSKLALAVTFNGLKCRSTPINLEDPFKSRFRKQMANISSSRRHSRHLGGWGVSGN